jgi:hypothetical protein
MNKKVLLFTLLLSYALGAMDFVADIAQAKQEHDWYKIQSSAYHDSLMPHSSAFTKLKLLSPEFCSLSFTYEGDTLPEGRRKLIHECGTSIKIAFEASKENEYSGIFESGASFGILRLSLALKQEVAEQSFWHSLGFEKKDNCIPGIALKFYIDYKPSLNIVAMPSLDGQEEANLFSYIFTTALCPAEKSIRNNIVSCVFKSALEVAGQPHGDIHALACDHLARVHSNGKKVHDYNAPYELLFIPTKSAKALFNHAKMSDDFREVLENRGNNLILFNVHARKSKDDPCCNFIGTIKATSNFIASAHGDNTFFKHYHAHNESSY